MLPGLVRMAWIIPQPEAAIPDKALPSDEGLTLVVRWVTGNRTVWWVWFPGSCRSFLQEVLRNTTQGGPS